MTDPQNDKPCRDCKRPTQHATERCDDCRTPAGRLVTALAAMGVKATPIDSFDVVVDKITVSADHLSWCLLCDDDTNDHAHNVEAAANAIAAIVQAPGLRAELDAIDEALRDACPSYTTPAGSVSRVEAVRGLQEQDEDLPKVYDLLSDAGFGSGPAFSRTVELIAERDTLAAEVKRLREEVFSAGPWVESEVYRGEWLRKRDGDAIAMTIPGGNGWVARLPGGDKRGPETSDAGRHAADLALLAAGYRLVGGVHPLPDEVRS